jgi:hypothetical protein
MWGSGGIAPPFLTSALDEGEWSAVCPGRFTAGTGNCVGPTASLHAIQNIMLHSIISSADTRRNSSSG